MKKLILAVALSLFAFGAFAGEILDEVKERGYLNCGVSHSGHGLSAPDSRGVYRGIDVDYCHALSAAIFGDASKVRFVPVSPAQRFAAAQNGSIDVLSRGTTWTASRDTGRLGIRFVGVNYYSGQGVMVRKSLNVNSLKGLNGATFCMQTGNEAERNLVAGFEAQGVQNPKYKVVAVEGFQQSVQALEAGRCDAYTVGRLGLHIIKSTMLTEPDDFEVLPEVLSKEPLGPSVRIGDDQFFDIARWTLFAFIEAEELGLTQANIDSMRDSESSDIQAFLGTHGSIAKELGAVDDWTYQIVKQVGNYGESYERNLAPIGAAERGINALWNQGGILYAPPVR